MPGVHFNYILCAYLPGYPLAITIYWLFLRGNYDKGHNDYYFVLYFLVAPLCIGILIDVLRHIFEEKTRKFKRVSRLFWVYPSLDEIPRIVKNRGKESLEQYVRTLDKLYYTYEHLWNLWISSISALVICIFYYLFVDKIKLNHPAIIFFVIILLFISSLYIYLVKNIRDIQAGLAQRITTPMQESQDEPVPEQ
jgi:hypothetical protein